MNISGLLSIVADAVPDRVAVRDEGHALTYRGVDDGANALAQFVRAGAFENISVIDTNSSLLPIALFGAAKAGVPFVPLNYRLPDEQLAEQVGRLGRTLLVVGDSQAERFAWPASAATMRRDEVLGMLQQNPAAPSFQSDAGSGAAAWLFTSGTTGAPKIVVIRHQNLVSYVIATVDLLSAEESEAALTSVPPYHIAGIASVLSSIFAGRQIVYLTSFEAREWISLAREAGVTQAMVVPTMLERILDALEEDGLALPALRQISYGGGRMPLPLIRRALQALPDVGFTNAYGLTETSSTVALLSPADHRAAIDSEDPSIQARLGSVGRAVPEIEIEIRDERSNVVPAGVLGEIWVRGPQVAGEYRGSGSLLQDGWFCTRDEGWLDEGGYLFVLGRADDVIVRGGENISPGEIEDVLRTQDGIVDVAVVAEHDSVWGESPVAILVLEHGTQLDEAELAALVRRSLRSSRVPTRFIVVDALPYSDTGKLLRNALRQDLRESKMLAGTDSHND